MVEAPVEATGLDLERKSAGPVPLETQPLETQPSETAQAESALKTGPMKSVRPLETDKDATDNAQDDKPLPTPDETSS